MLISAEGTVLFLKKRMISIVILSALVLMAASVTLVQAEQQRLSAKLIRLHVVANSDSAHDQAIKLEVRDAVSVAAKALLDGAEDPRAALAGRLDAIADAAAARLRELGEDLPVTVRLGKERFPTREYDTFSPMENPAVCAASSSSSIELVRQSDGNTTHHQLCPLPAPMVTRSDS